MFVTVPQKKLVCFKSRRNAQKLPIGFYYVIKDRQGDLRTDQTDEHWLGAVEQAKKNATQSIDNALDEWWAISCLATYRNKTEHFALFYFGEQDGAVSYGLEELSKRCPGYKYSVKFAPRVNRHTIGGENDC